MIEVRVCADFRTKAGKVVSLRLWGKGKTRGRAEQRLLGAIARARTKHGYMLIRSSPSIFFSY